MADDYRKAANTPENKRYLSRFAGKSSTQRRSMVASDEHARDEDKANVRKARSDAAMDRVSGKRTSKRKSSRRD